MLTTDPKGWREKLQKFMQPGVSRRAASEAVRAECVAFENNADFQAQEDIEDDLSMPYRTFINFQKDHYDMDSDDADMEWNRLRDRDGSAEDTTHERVVCADAIKRKRARRGTKRVRHSIEAFKEKKMLVRMWWMRRNPTLALNPRSPRIEPCCQMMRLPQSMAPALERHLQQSLTLAPLRLSLKVRRRRHAAAQHLLVLAAPPLVGPPRKGAMGRKRLSFAKLKATTSAL